MFVGRESLRQLVRNQHEEFMRWQEDQKKDSRRCEEEREAKSEAWQEEQKAKSEDWEEKLTREFREFNREILLRNEKVYTAVIAELEEMGEADPGQH